MMFSTVLWPVDEPLRTLVLDGISALSRDLVPLVLRAVIGSPVVGDPCLERVKNLELVVDCPNTCRHFQLGSSEFFCLAARKKCTFGQHSLESTSSERRRPTLPRVHARSCGT